jgi:hypothetical protein
LLLAAPLVNEQLRCELQGRRSERSVRLLDPFRPEFEDAGACRDLVRVDG